MDGLLDKVEHDKRSGGSEANELKRVFLTTRANITRNLLPGPFNLERYFCREMFRNPKQSYDSVGAFSETRAKVLSSTRNMHSFCYCSSTLSVLLCKKYLKVPLEVLQCNLFHQRPLFCYLFVLFPVRKTFSSSEV